MQLTVYALRTAVKSFMVSYKKRYAAYQPYDAFLSGTNEDVLDRDYLEQVC